MSEATIAMKLLIDKKANRVLFAEAGKECVDFLFHILALPVGTVVRCLTKGAMAGSVGNLYDSLDNISCDYLEDNVTKDCLLNPTPAAGTAQNVPLLTINQAASYPAGIKRFYKCSKQQYQPHVLGGSACASYDKYVSDGAGANCPGCGYAMNKVVEYVEPPAVDQKVSRPLVGGYVKGVVTYMIMDDLVVKPMSTISGITMLNKFNVKDVGCLEGKEVKLDKGQASSCSKYGVALLRASLVSKTVLTDVFLGNMRV